MSVGVGALSCYQKEDVQWRFTVTDANVTDITGWTIALVVKLTAASADPPLLGPFTASIIGGAPTLICEIDANINLNPGTYVYSLRRTDVGFSWQLAQGALTVLDSASLDP